MINHLWQSTVFAILAAILTLAFRGNRAQVRYWLWFGASLKFLVPFALLIALGSRLEWPAQQVSPARFSAPLVEIAQPFADTVPFLTPADPKSPDWVPLAFFGLWACGSAAIVLMRFRGWLRVRAAVRASAPLEIPVPVDVRSAPGLLEPGVVGFLRPILLLPEGIAERLTPRQLEAVLAHELCHVRRRDNLTSAIHMIVEAVFWFHPLVWWIGARLVDERERACDEVVLSLGNEPQVYAEGILNVCKIYSESPLRCVSGVTGSDLKKRIQAILTGHVADELNFAKRAALAVAALAALALPVISRHPECARHSRSISSDAEIRSGFDPAVRQGYRPRQTEGRGSWPSERFSRQAEHGVRHFGECRSWPAGGTHSAGLWQARDWPCCSSRVCSAGFRRPGVDLFGSLQHQRESGG